MKFKADFRKGNPEDHALILSSWLNGAYNHCSAFRDMPKSLFYGLHHVTCKRLLACSDTLLCVDAEDPHHVLGYLVYVNYKNFSVIHWVYVKQVFRKFGMGVELLKRANLHKPILTSHETFNSNMYFNRKGFATYHCPHFRHGDWHEDSLGVFLSSRSD